MARRAGLLLRRASKSVLSRGCRFNSWQTASPANIALRNHTPQLIYLASTLTALTRQTFQYDLPRLPNGTPRSLALLMEYKPHCKADLPLSHYSPRIYPAPLFSHIHHTMHGVH
ncbi:hypothetical protein BJY04DRAFT_53093 [Aspergillus karnatakaensis]|uniref:uncharacterized protein n=1 Tax=Aspergillus karnatakaensis TaxID=1810916 RepID=UPI003CCDF183